MDTLPDTQAYTETKEIGDTLDDIKVEALVNTPADTQVEAKSERHCNTLGDVENQEQVDLLNTTLLQARADTLPHSLSIGRLTGRGEG